MFRRIITGCLAALGILLFILDSRTALTGGQEGIDLCIHSIVPSIFPFLVLSGMLTSTITGTNLRILRPLGRILGIPKGTEGIFLTGLLGGYPIGAQAVHQAWMQGQLHKKDAQRMLAFSSNAGPSFLFGILGMQFSKTWVLWMLWAVHILSAIAVGALLPGKSADINSLLKSKPITLTQSLKRSVMTMGIICGWVILFRVILAFLDRWILWVFPVSVQVGIHGLLELANGCCQVSLVPSEGLRFMICSIMLAFGGICVCLQTASVTGDLGIGQYLPGKILQMIVSLILSTIIQYFMFSPSQRSDISPFWMLIPIICIILIIGIHRKIEKKSSIPAVTGV